MLNSILLVLLTFVSHAAVVSLDGETALPPPVDMTLSVDGKSLPLQQFADISYSHFELEGPASFELTCKENCDKATISPKHAKIACASQTDVVRFQLGTHGYFVLHLNDGRRVFLLAEPKLALPEKKRVDVGRFGVVADPDKEQTKVLQEALNQAAERSEILFFPAGIYKTGPLTLGSGTHVFLAPGAVLCQAELSPPQTEKERQGFITIRDADSVTIEGYGTIDARGTAMRERFGDRGRARLLLIRQSKNIVVKGIVLRDPGVWNTHIYGCDQVVFSHCKQLNNQEISNTDGFDPDSSENVLIENCFAYNGDDNIAIKNSKSFGAPTGVRNITVRGCVFLTRKSSLKVGTETLPGRIENILFENNDVVDSDRGIALYLYDGAVFENIRYINNRFERNWPDLKQAMIYIELKKRYPESKVGIMKNILLRDNAFEVPFPNPVRIIGLKETAPIALTIENWTVGGKKIVSKKDTPILVDDTSEIKWIK